MDGSEATQSSDSRQGRLPGDLKNYRPTPNVLGTQGHTKRVGCLLPSIRRQNALRVLRGKLFDGREDRPPQRISPNRDHKRQLFVLADERIPPTPG